MRKGENIYLRKDGRWEGRYPKGRKINGKIKYGYVYGKTYSEVRQKLYPLRIRYSSLQQLHGSSAETFEEWAAEWISEVQDEVKPSTLSSYYYKLTKYIFPLIRNTPLNELSLETGKMILKELQITLSPSTIQVIFRIINKCLNRAKKIGKLHVNPFSELKSPKAKGKKGRALSLVEQKRIMTVAAKEKKGYGIPTLLALHSGMRVGEIAALKWSDIDFDSNLIYVNHTYQRIPTIGPLRKTQLILAESKTEASVRMIPMSRTLKKLLTTHRKQSKGNFVFSTKGLPCEPRLLTHHFHRIREKAELANVHFHQLRHTFATRCLEANRDIPSVSALLGHASTQMTLDTYVDAMLEQRCLVINKLDKLIS
ncbi:MAG: site-specific integrase [Enterococcus sp.]|nr:site-specific integrase [Enterococcus sp.]MDN6005217.1 site-specific integrase [Enterococcus sp.]MDN6753414.1 site-specific integrase [Enterococcus sp.]MDN6775407.1 site-specific integrase [Enterococcus sp.]MDN6829414.1 site-specific integrase [Enterococcus sp.]